MSESKDTTLFFDEDGKEVTALDLVTSISVTASVGRKLSDGNYGSMDAFASQSMTASVPPNTDPTVIAGILYDVCVDDVTARLNARQPVTDAAPVETVNYVPPPSETVKVDADTVDWADLANSDEGQGQQLQYAPAAADRVPGQWWTKTITEYRLTADRLELWAGGKYAEASLTPKSPAWPENWLGHMVADGTQQPFTKPVLATMEVSTNSNSKGNYYVDVVRLMVAPPGEHTKYSDPRSEYEATGRGS